ncbi:MAG: MBL fold metallo-hydrolase [Geodermatophilaceae bacterium]|nr:MBL fold metallo-hydrolase [Geodermatophilaceae bacterium]MDQ3454916.1 MBL fold metallo-hydrolase [Actinomycetota bacterium]
MQVQKLGHACLLLTTTAGNRVLIDPGTFSSGFEDLTELSGILITHQHADHLDLERLPALLVANPTVMLFADPASAGVLREHGFDAEVAEHGGRYDLNGVAVEGIGTTHATIHADIPLVPNVGYLVEGQLFHPGDALTVPDRAIDVLALPAGAPWAKSGEVIDYLREVAPRVAVPIHEGTLARPQMEYTRYAELGPTGTEFVVIDDGEPREF